MGGEVWAYVEAFYGIPVAGRSLLRTAYAWRKCRGGLLFADILSHRPSPPSSSSAVRRLPPEVWQLVRFHLIDAALDASMEEFMTDEIECDDCEECCRFRLLTEDKDEEDEDEGLSLRDCWVEGQEWVRECSNCEGQDCWNLRVFLQDEFEGRVGSAAQTLLSSYGLCLPTTDVHDDRRSKDRLASSLSFIALSPFPPTQKPFYKPSWTADEGGAFLSLEDVRPASEALRSLERFVREWDIEVSQYSGSQKTVYRGEEKRAPFGKKEKKKVQEKAIKPCWRVLATSGRDD